TLKCGTKTAYEPACRQIESGHSCNAFVLSREPVALVATGRWRIGPNGSPVGGAVRGEFELEPSAPGQFCQRGRKSGPGFHAPGGGVGEDRPDAPRVGGLFRAGNLGTGIQLFERYGVVGIYVQRGG